jgi:hypothetical protein
VTSEGTTIPVHASLFRWPWTVRLDYAGPAAALALRFGGNVRFAGNVGSGGRWTAVTLPAGAHAIYVPLLGAGSEITIRLAGTAPAVLGSAPTPAGIAPPMCLTGVTVGTWQPTPSGPALPAAPVPG